MEESEGFIAIKSTNKTKVTAMLRFSMSQIIDQFLLNQLQQILWMHHHSLEPELLANRPYINHMASTTEESHCVHLSSLGVHRVITV